MGFRRIAGQDLQQQSGSEKLNMHDTAGLGIPDEQWLGITAQLSAYTNTVLRQLYPQGDDIAATDIVAFFKAGQVNVTYIAPIALPVLLSEKVVSKLLPFICHLKHLSCSYIGAQEHNLAASPD